MPASPRGSFALAQALVAGVCQIGQKAGTAIDPQILRFFQIAASLVLTGCAAFEIWSGGRPYSFVLLAGAIMMAIAAWRQADAPQVAASPAAGVASCADALQSQIVMQLTAQRAVVRPGTTANQALSGEAWGDLMARVSHDLRTPLNAVIGFSDVMGSELFGPVGDERYRDYIAHIRDSGRELLKSAEDTLAITSLLGSRGSAADAINLETLACEAIRSAGVVGADVEIDDTIDVIGERRGLRQALVNLVSEGSLRAAGGSSLRISASCEDEFVILQVTAQAVAAKAGSQEASLHVCMARVLLELQGAQLIEIERDGEWRAVTVVGRAAQQDFFAPGTVPMGWQPRRQLETRLPS